MSVEPVNEFDASPCGGWWGLGAPAYDERPEPPIGDFRQPPYVDRSRTPSAGR